MTPSEAEGRALARALLAELDPEEMEFFEEYARAAGVDVRGGRLGPEWGISDSVSMSPVLVAAGLYLFEVLKSWTADVPKKIVEGFLVDGGKDRLKAWLGAPKKGEVATMVTAEGRTEIVAIVGRLIAQAKLSPRDAERTSRIVAGHLFGDGAKKG